MKYSQMLHPTTMTPLFSIRDHFQPHQKQKITSGKDEHLSCLPSAVSILSQGCRVLLELFFSLPPFKYQLQTKIRIHFINNNTIPINTINSIMKNKKLPINIIRNTINNSITLFAVPQQVKYSLIWLHGLGGDAENYVSFFSHRDSTVYSGCRIRLIQAPKRYVTISNQENTSWYDIRSLKRFTEPEENVFNFEHIQHSHSIIQDYFDQQLLFWRDKDKSTAIIPQKRVYIGGMSQGGVMSLHYALSSTLSPGGAICFSGYSLKSTPNKNINSLATLLVHGNRDSTIRQIDARNSYAKLMQNKNLVEYHTIKKLDHSICLQQIGMVSNWMEKIHQRHLAKQIL